MPHARSFFYACAIEDAEEAISNLLSLRVLAELKDEAKSEQFEDYQLGGVPDAGWEASLRADWPGKKELLQRLVREWNRYPLQRITQGGTEEQPFSQRSVVAELIWQTQDEPQPSATYEIPVSNGLPEPRVQQLIE